MIPNNFIYYRPSTLQEATEVFSQCQREGKQAIYYAGGSEIITLCRGGSLCPDVVIDIKNIPQCMLLALDDQGLHMGSCSTLNQIKESNFFHLLGLSCGRIADHTNQCRITLGGNLCGTIHYRESSLPLLISDAQVTLFGLEGERRVPFQSVFKGKMQLHEGELIVQIHVPIWALHARFFHVKKTANEKIDYPLLSLGAILKEDQLRIAFSGICSHPFRSESIEKVLNDHSKSVEKRAKEAVAILPFQCLGDGEGSGEYRRFVLKNTLHTLLEDWNNDTI